MQYINYRKVSYILSETPGISGKIAFEFLLEIVNLEDVLKFTFYGQENNSQSIDSLIEMHNNTNIIVSKKRPKEFVIKNICINDKLLKLMCSLGEFPNFTKVSKIDSNLTHTNFYWSIEYCDEILTFIYQYKYFDDSKIALIEKKLESQGISYERKEASFAKYVQQ